MKIFVINLPSAVKRHDYMSQQLEGLKLEHEFVEAIDGRKMTSQEIAKVTQLEGEKWLTPSEIGCALSHLSIYERMTRESIDWALILEDDARLDPMLPEFLKSFHLMKKKLALPQIILLSPAARFAANKFKILPDSPFRLHTTIRAVSTSAYLINLEAACALHKQLFPVFIHIDCWGYIKRNFISKIDTVYPFLVDINTEFDTQMIGRYENDTLLRNRLKSKVYKTHGMVNKLKMLGYKLFQRPFTKVCKFSQKDWPRHMASSHLPDGKV